MRTLLVVLLLVTLVTAVSAQTPVTSAPVVLVAPATPGHSSFVSGIAQDFRDIIFSIMAIIGGFFFDHLRKIAKASAERHNLQLSADREKQLNALAVRLYHQAEQWGREQLKKGVDPVTITYATKLEQFVTDALQVPLVSKLSREDLEALARRGVGLVKAAAEQRAAEATPTPLTASVQTLIPGEPLKTLQPLKPLQG